MLRVYGVPGCGPCEVAQMFLKGRGVSFEFVNLHDAAERKALTEKLGSPTSGVILEDDEHLEVMQGVSVGGLMRWLEGYRQRHPQAEDTKGV